MEMLDTSKRLGGILICCILLIFVYACQTPSKYERMTGTLKPILPTAEDINEIVNTTFAEGIEKISLGIAIPENIENPHPYLVAIASDGRKLAYGTYRGKNIWFMVIDNQKGPDFSSVSFPVFSPDGSKLAYAAMQNGKWFIMINDKKGPEFEQVSVPVFSPDGSKLAYAAMQNGKWFIMTNDKKGPEFDLIYSDYTFSPDSSKFAYGIKRGGKAFIVVDEKEEGGFDAVASPVFSPLGNKVAYFAVQDNKTFIVVDGKKGPEYDDFRRDITFSPDGKKIAYVAMRETKSKASESLIVVLKLDDNNNLTLYKTFGPLNVSVSKAQPLTMANITGTGWSPTFNIDGSKIAYGVNGGPSAAIKEPIRTTPPGRYYYIENSIGNSTIEIDGNIVANISNTGLVTPLLFSPDSKEISWIVLKDRKLYLKKLKLK